MSVDTVLSLYHSGLLVPAGIVGAFLLLTWLGKHVAWFAAPNRAHYLAILLGGLATVAGPASAGTTPNAQMILGAVVAMLTLALPGIAPTVTPAARSPMASSVRDLAVMLAVPALVASCALLKADAKVMSGDFKTCAKADLGAVVDSNGATLLADVAAIVMGNGASLEADLGALAVKVGLDAVECAIAAVEAVESPAVGSGSATPSTSQPAVPAGLARAKTWLATQRAAK